MAGFSVFRYLFSFFMAQPRFDRPGFFYSMKRSVVATSVETNIIIHINIWQYQKISFISHHKTNNVGNIKIKKNIDFPEASYERSSAGADPKWPFGDLEIGDGFEAPVKQTNAIRCSMQHFQRWYPGKKFKSKKVGNKVLVKRIA